MYFYFGDELSLELAALLSVNEPAVELPYKKE